MFTLNFTKISKSIEKGNTNIMKSAQLYQRSCNPHFPTVFGTRAT